MSIATPRLGCDGVTLQKPKQRRAASGYLPFAHRGYNLVQRQVRLFLDDGENLLGVILQR